MKKILILAAMTALFASCNNDDESCNQVTTTSDDDQIGVSALMGEINPGTRITDDGTNASFADGDAIGLFCTQSAPAADNLQYTYAATGTLWTPTAPIYWKNTTASHDFYAYAPYAASNTVSAVAIPVLNTQTGTIASAQNVVFSKLTGITKTTDSGKAKLVFNHALTLIQLDIKIDGTVPVGAKLTSATLTGAAADAISTSATGATLNLTSGVITPGSAKTNIVTATPSTSPVLSSTATSIYILVLPGIYTPSLTVQCQLADGTTNPNAIVSLGSLTLVQSTKYIYTVSVSRSAINITGLTISPWLSGGTPVAINPIL